MSCEEKDAEASASLGGSTDLFLLISYYWRGPYEKLEETGKGRAGGGVTLTQRSRPHLWLSSEALAPERMRNLILGILPPYWRLRRLHLSCPKERSTTETVFVM